MHTLVKLSPTLWLNLATVVEISDEDGRLSVLTTGTCADRFGNISPWALHLEGAERAALLTWLTVLEED